MEVPALRIGEVSRRTGVTAATLRAWEHRFGVPRPTRTGRGQRLYSLDEVEKVHRVRELVRKGWAVGAAAAYAARGAGGVDERSLGGAGRRQPTALLENTRAEANEPPLTASMGAHDPMLLEVAHQATRALLAASSPREVVSVVVGVVHGLGGYTAPARLADDTALPIDISLGEGEPVLPLAPAVSVARMRLEQVLPMLLEDARRVVTLLRRADAAQ